MVFWEDDEEDPKIDNIMKAMLGEFGQWKWLRTHWEVTGIKVSNNVKVDLKDVKKRPLHVEEESGKRHCPGPSNPSTDVMFNLVETVKKEIDTWGSALIEEIKAGFRTCESRYNLLTEKVEGLSTDVKGLKEAWTGEQAKANLKETDRNRKDMVSNPTNQPNTRSRAKNK